MGIATNALLVASNLKVEQIAAGVPLATRVVMDIAGSVRTGERTTLMPHSAWHAPLVIGVKMDIATDALLGVSRMR